MYRSRAALETAVDRRLTWDDFMAQVVLLAEIYHKSPVLARKTHKYTYLAHCPKCTKENPLDGHRAIIWRVTCECGNSFIATA